MVSPLGFEAKLSCLICTLAEVLLMPFVIKTQSMSLSRLQWREVNIVYSQSDQQIDKASSNPYHLHILVYVNDDVKGIIG